MTALEVPSLRTLGNSDLQLTPIGFGAWAIGGGDWAYAWGPQDDQESIAAIHRALDLGINWIDTAAIYGLGHSEEVVARALQVRFAQALCVYQVRHPLEGDRSPYRSLKAASVHRRAGGLAAAAQAWRRIDLYQIHWPDPEEEIEEAWAATGAFPGAGESALDWGVELQCGADGAHPEDRAHHQPAAALLDAASGDRGGDSSVYA